MKLDIFVFGSLHICVFSHLFDVCICSAGSRYWQSGSFEVSKADTEAADSLESMSEMPCSAVRVTVLTELEGIAYIQVTIRDSTNVDGGNGK